MLLDTGNAELVEVSPSLILRAHARKISREGEIFNTKKDSPRDWFWGIGADGTGNNELGKALMRLRDELRAFLCVSRLVWHRDAQRWMLFLAGNEANGGTATPTPTPSSKSKSTSTSNHRSQGRAGASKRQAPHVSGSRGSTHGMCEVGSSVHLAIPTLSPLSRSPHLFLCLTSFVVPNRRADAPSTVVVRVQTVLRRCAR